MQDLNYQLKELGHRNRDGSRSTQAHRARILSLCANQLVQLGYRRLTAGALRTTHVDALVRHWQAQGIAVGTLKNRLATLRWWADKIGKQNIVARSNAHYGIPSRSFVARSSKAKELTEPILGRVRDRFVALSLQLQRLFGLRREEAIKFMPSYADRGDRLTLKPTWTKGRRARSIPIRNQAQRDLLRTVHEAAGSGALIPRDRRYVDQLRTYERQVAEAGLSNAHGLRHAYAQERYRELTGWDCPVAGGPSSRDLDPDQREIDREARMVVSEELGHAREQIAAVYLGR